MKNLSKWNRKYVSYRWDHLCLCKFREIRSWLLVSRQY